MNVVKSRPTYFWFWVRLYGESAPKLVEGKLRQEGPGEWCAGEWRFYPSCGGIHNAWFDNPEDVIAHDSKMKRLMTKLERELEDQ